ncbi:PadR family transcriptional regulator [Arthrobacter livingstonensis]|uniref:PadR family transcriptional regulator n=1 Tax=Arthrobacter livingstonensis TaxID=670078 RepID=A0A2V5LBQ5_9MICC|nr:PadR family transcriptional regulator [Arthrobacter livingstonensis]
MAVLALLEEAPMHPYRMQQLITLRGKDKVINVGQRASLYTTIDRLSRDGQIRVSEVERDGQRPERSVYEITDAGRATAHGWLTDMLSVPKRGFPDFHAALAHAPMLTQEALTALLRSRRDLVAAEVAELREEITRVSAFLPRVVLLDSELMCRTRATELDFLDDVLSELESGAMTWSRESLAALSQTNEPHP